jgi:hypothetical protein
MCRWTDRRVLWCPRDVGGLYLERSGGLEETSWCRGGLMVKMPGLEGWGESVEVWAIFA